MNNDQYISVNLNELICAANNDSLFVDEEDGETEFTDTISF